MRAARLPSSTWSDSRVDPARAKALNKQIMRVAGMLPGATEHEFAFTCECGCGGLARCTGAQFAHACGAWLDGHRERAIRETTTKPPQQ